MKKEKKKESRKFFIRIFYSAFIISVLLFIFLKGKNILLEYRNEWWSPFLFVTLQIIQVLIFPLPGQWLSILSGYMYGVVYGTLLSITGIWIGGTLSIIVSRFIFRNFFIKLIEKKGWKTFLYLKNIKKSLYFLPYFFIPNPLGDLIMYAMGLSGINILSGSLIILIGRFAGTMVYAAIGYGVLYVPQKYLIIGGILATSLVGLYLFLSIKFNFSGNRIFKRLK